TNQTLTVLQASLNKAFSPIAIDVGGTSTLTFTLANSAGNPAQSGINFTDTLPANVVVAAAPALTTTCPSGTGVVTAAAGSGTVTVTGASIGAAQASCVITVNVTSSVIGGPYNNTSANIGATARITNSVTSSGLTVVQASLDKAFAPTTISQGATSTLTFTITNGAGNPAQSGINFTDTLPTAITVAATPNVTTTCPSGTGVVTAVAGS